VPELVLVELDPEMGRSEPDPEIQDLLRASAGLNLALDYLPGSLGFDPVVEVPDPLLASSVLWFDALVTNVDRTPRNTNLLVWHRKLWLIDHGAALYFHHNWPATEEELLNLARRPFAAAKDHVLRPFASRLEEADARLAPLLTPERLRAVVDLVPDEWLADERGFEAPEDVRAAYLEFFGARLEGPRAWAEALVGEAGP
jgi:hypothetical protein